MNKWRGNVGGRSNMKYPIDMEAWATGQVNRVRVFNSTQKFWVVRPNFYEDGSIYTTSSLVR